MTAQAQVQAYDGVQPTPVIHSFLPSEVYKDPKDGSLVATWKEGVTTVPDIAQGRVTMRKRKLPNGMYRLSVKTETPVMEAVNGANASGYTAAPKVAYTNTFECVAHYHERSTIAERRINRQLGINVAQSYVTSVTVATTGPAAELFDQLVSVS